MDRAIALPAVRSCANGDPGGSASRGGAKGGLEPPARRCAPRQQVGLPAPHRDAAAVAICRPIDGCVQRESSNARPTARLAVSFPFTYDGARSGSASRSDDDCAGEGRTRRPSRARPASARTGDPATVMWRR